MQAVVSEHNASVRELGQEITRSQRQRRTVKLLPASRQLRKEWARERKMEALFSGGASIRQEHERRAQVQLDRLSIRGSQEVCPGGKSCQSRVREICSLGHIPAAPQTKQRIRCERVSER